MRAAEASPGVAAELGTLIRMNHRAAGDVAGQPRPGHDAAPGAAPPVQAMLGDERPEGRDLGDLVAARVGIVTPEGTAALAARGCGC